MALKHKQAKIIILLVAEDCRNSVENKSSCSHHCKIPGTHCSKITGSKCYFWAPNTNEFLILVKHRTCCLWHQHWTTTQRLVLRAIHFMPDSTQIKQMMPFVVKFALILLTRIFHCCNCNATKYKERGEEKSMGWMGLGLPDKVQDEGQLEFQIHEEQFLA